MSCELYFATPWQKQLSPIQPCITKKILHGETIKYLPSEFWLKKNTHHATKCLLQIILLGAQEK